MNDKENPIGDVVHLFYEKLNPYIKENMIWKVQLDTYNRELERYGNRLIEDGESVFCIDSECVISCIKKLNTIANEDYRWMITLKMIDSLLNDFSFDNARKTKIMEEVSSSFKMEFGFNEYNAKQFNVKYRDHKKTVEEVLRNKIDEKNFHILLSHVHTKSKKMKPIAKTLNLKLEKRKDITIDSLLKSYIHMMLNRVFRTKNRVHELVIYDFMRRFYTSEDARLKYSKANTFK